MNEKNFVGLTVNSEYIACGSESNEVYVYHKVRNSRQSIFIHSRPHSPHSPRFPPSPGPGKLTIDFESMCRRSQNL